MALPILGIFLGILITLGGTMTTLALIAVIIEELYRYFFGKKIAIIGERATGKTKLWEFLSKGVISKDYLQTQSAEKVEVKDLHLKDLELTLKESQIDVPGGWDFVESWINLARESDFVFFLFRLPCIYNSEDSCRLSCPFKNMLLCEGRRDYIKKTEIALKKIKDNYLVHKTVLVGTFADYVNDYIELERNGKEGNFHEKFIKSIDYNFSNLIKDFKIVFGSLKDTSSAEKLTVKIFKKAMER
ncbi:MAG: hypothetical protein QXN68_03455 [Thermoplasmata archaeon]